MNPSFAEKLRRLRTEKGLSQLQLAEMMFVTRSTITRWESGSRMPDAAMIMRLSRCLGIDAGTLLGDVTEPDECPNVIMVDDERIILSGGLPILEEVLPEASVIGFTRSSEAIEYARGNDVALAFLDVEMGKVSGLDLCRELQKINPRTNVVFLTAYLEYSFEAWDTGACGFLLKPITAEAVRKQLRKLRCPLKGMNIL
ncbi:MAG: response regulator [Clostridiales bacterium]|nr:response regulator [Clostridiales bacterium]